MSENSRNKEASVSQSTRPSLSWTIDEWPVLWEAILNTVQEGVCLLDHQGRVIAINREGCRAIEWASREVVGRSWHDVVKCTAIADRLACPVDMVNSDRRVVFGDQVTITTRTGKNLTVSYTCAPTGLGEGHPTAIFRFRDLSATAHMLDELRSARILLNESPIAIVELDEQGLMIWGNQAALHHIDQYGYRDSMVPAILPENIKDCVRAALLQEHPLPIVNVELKGVSCTWLLKRIAGSPSRVCGYALMEMESSSGPVPGKVTREQLLHVFTSSVNHRLGLRQEAIAILNAQIRNPLQDILGMMDLMEQTDLTGPQRIYIDAVRQACEDVSDVMRELHTLVTSETTHSVAGRQAFIPGQVFEEALGIVAQEGVSQETDIVGMVAPNSWDVYEGQSGHVADIIRTTLRQAVKNSPGGKVTACLRMEDVNEDTSILSLDVRDVGASIEEAVQRDALEEMQSIPQGLNPTQDHRRIIGLELPLAKRLCGLMGGALDVRYASGEGNIYDVRLLVRRTETKSKNAPVYPWTCTRALVIGGDVLEQASVVQGLLRFGIASDVVETLVEAEQCIEEQHQQQKMYDVGFLVVGRGETVPLELMKTWREDEKLRGCPFVLIADGRTPLEKDLVFQSGMSAILRKPVRTASLEVCLRAVCGDTSTERIDTLTESIPTSLPSLSEQLIHEGRVLVIDHHTSHHVALRSLLEGLGYAVDLVSTGHSGIEAFKETEYAAVLCDCFLPDMNGYSVVSELRRLEGAERRTRIIGLSADYWDEAKGYAVGIDRLMTKPVALDGLRQALKRDITT